MIGAAPLLVAALAVVFAAVTMATPISVRGRLRVVASPGGVAAAPGQRLLGVGRATVARPRVPAAAAGVALLLGTSLTVVVAGVVGGLAALAYGGAGWLALRRRAQARAATAVRAAGAVALAGLADDLRAGLTPHAALHTAVLAIERGPLNDEVRAALAAVRTGATRAGAGPDDVVRALRAVSGPLAPALRRLAAAWALTDSGIPLADVVDRLDVELRLQRRAADRAEAHTASARMTARLVAGLPLVGLGIGQLLGAQPLTVLTGTPAGAVCALVAVALHLAGFAVTGRLGRVAVA